MDSPGYLDVPLVFSAGDLIFVAYVWDNDGIPAASNNEFYLYAYNEDTTTTATGSLGGTVGSGISNSVRVGNRWTAGGGDGPADGVIDNIKIYDYAKTDFSDKDQEGI